MLAIVVAWSAVLFAVPAGSSQDVPPATLTPEEMERENAELRSAREREQAHARAALRVRLIAPSRVSRGQTVRFRYEIANVSDEPATVGTGLVAGGGFPTFVVDAARPDGTWAEVWDWKKCLAPDSVFILPLIMHHVRRAAPHRIAIEWKQVDLQGAPVPSGRYRVRSRSDTQPELPDPAPVEFEIAPLTARTRAARAGSSAPGREVATTAGRASCDTPYPVFPPGVVMPCRGEARCYRVCRQAFSEHLAEYLGPLVPAFRDGQVVGLRMGAALRDLGVAPDDALVQFDGRPVLSPHGAAAEFPLDVRRTLRPGTHRLELLGPDGAPALLKLLVRECP